MKLTEFHDPLVQIMTTIGFTGCSLFTNFDVHHHDRHSIMLQLTATIVRYQIQGEKTGWTYIEIPADVAQMLKPGQRKSFQVKGFIDAHQFTQVSLLPVGKGNFVLPLNARVRKQIRKAQGAMVNLRIEADDTSFTIPAWLTDCLEDEPAAQAFFYKLVPSHQKYFVKWIESARTETTRIKRIALSVTAFSRGMGFGEMIRWNREQV